MPTECENLWLIINHKDYIQSLQENILVNLVDADFIYVKLAHACDHLRTQLSEIDPQLAASWCLTLEQHVKLSYEYLSWLKQKDIAKQTQTLNDWHQVHVAAREFLKDHKLWNRHYNCLTMCFMHRCNSEWHLDQEFWQQNYEISKHIAELMWLRFSHKS